MIKMKQVHGSRIVRVGRADDGKIIKNCDGLITNTRGLFLSIHVADCLPVFLYSPTTNSIGLVHAGWQGLSKGIIRKSITLMQKEFKIKNLKLTVYIGPFICQKHYEVKDSVAGKFRSYPKAIKNIKGEIFLDLGEVAKEQLIKAGVDKNKIQFNGKCTFEEKNLASFRRGDLKKETEYCVTLPDPS